MNATTLKLLVVIATLTIFAPSLVAMEQPEQKESITPLSLGERPPTIQYLADEAFRKLQTSTEKWKYDGSKAEFYHLMQLDEAQIIRHIATTSPNKEIYLLDVGAGAGGWGKAVMKLLEEEFSNSDKHFNILSVTGGHEIHEEVITKNNVTLYQFSGFKIENIESEFIYHGRDLTGKVDLIVSHWTLRHLVDPFGTLRKLYNLLTPGYGTLLSNGFSFKFNEEKEPANTSHYSHWNILASSKAKSLFYISPGIELDHFMLIRPDDQPLQLPINYTDDVYYIREQQTASGYICGFTSGSNLDKKAPKLYPTHDRYNCRTYYGNEKSKTILDEILKRKWLYVTNCYSKLDDSLAELSKVLSTAPEPADGTDVLKDTIEQLRLCLNDQVQQYDSKLNKRSGWFDARVDTESLQYALYESLTRKIITKDEYAILANITQTSSTTDASLTEETIQNILSHKKLMQDIADRIAQNRTGLRCLRHTETKNYDE